MSYKTDPLGLSSKGKMHIITIFQRTAFVICSHSREGKTLSYIVGNYSQKFFLEY